MEGEASDLRGMEDCGLWGRGRKGGRGEGEVGKWGSGGKVGGESEGRARDLGSGGGEMNVVNVGCE